jgi:hypothetical protein
MRCIPLKGFSDHDLYVRESAGRTTILRVLHRKRDLLASLQSPEP